MIAMITASLYGNALDRELDRLTECQQDILFKTYRLASEYNLQWTMTAIAWQESRFGKNMIGRTTPDFGVFQISLKSFKARYKKVLKDDKVTEVQMVRMLLEDYDLNFTASLAEIKYWQHRHNNNYSKIWASYNGGHKGNPVYSAAIKKKIKALRRYIQRNELAIMVPTTQTD